ncbi:MAG: addiction module protein [Vulcanimicrobiota bacterium]
MANLDDVLKDALELDTEQRATLAERLIASLDHLPLEESDRLWAEEAQRRRNDLKAGRARLVDAEDVHAKAAELLS